jgi:hypothetical protein
LSRQWTAFFFRYLFHLRISFVFGLLLLLLPFICLRLAPAMLENLSEMGSGAQFIAVVLVTVVLSKAVITTGHVALVRSPERFLGLPQVSRPSWLPKLWHKKYFPRPRDIAAFVLAAPTLIWLFINSQAVVTWSVLLMALLASLLFVWAYRALADLPPSRPVQAAITKALLWLGLRQGYISESTKLVDVNHLKAALFWLLATTVYIIGFFAFAPNSSYEVPALVSLLLLAAVMCLLLGGLAYFLDYYKIPTLLSFGLLSLSSYLYWGTDHYYQLSPLATPKAAEDTEQVILGALKQRLALQDRPDKTLVLVATAGGGIQASAWTARVLTGLENSLGYIAPFSREIGFISSVSGGSVGTLFYVDRFNDNGVLGPQDLERDTVFQNATESNLDAIGWGLAYGDFWRLIGIPVAKYKDRGSALEDDWQHNMTRQGEATFSTWRNDMLAGKKPIAVFNATLVETGDRYLLCPLTLEANKESTYKSRDFNTLYPGHDIKVRTAARLSATFPYVSPAARNSQGERVRYVVDGGYFDNFGVFTTVNFLREHVLPHAAELGIKQVLVLEIRAFPNRPVMNKPYLTKTGEQNLLTPWLVQLVNPLMTLFSVRDSTQTARNHVELQSLKETEQLRALFERQKISFESVALVFPEWERTLPLSWKLRRQQIEDLNHGWLLTVQNTEYQKLKRLWQAWHP